MNDDILQIGAGVSIPRDELRFRFSRSSGPGGQHVQKSSTRVELFFDVAASPSLSDEQRDAMLAPLAERGLGDAESRGLFASS